MRRIFVNTPQPNDSTPLFSPGNGQLDLLPPLQADAFERLECAGEFTGERLKRYRPDTYRAVAVLLSQNVGVIRIGQLLQVSPNTVMAVRDAETKSIAELKLSLSQIAHQGAQLGLEGIRDQLATILAQAAKPGYHLEVKDVRDLAVVTGLLIQNGQLLAGEATSRHEEVAIQAPDHDDFNRYIAALPQAAATSLGAKNPGAKEAPGSVGDRRSEAGTDSQSDGKTS